MVDCSHPHADDVPKCEHSARRGIVPGARLVGLEARVIDEVFDHPAQRQHFRSITEHISDLRSSSTTAQFVEFQRGLFRDAYRVDNRRAECVQNAKRIRAGKSALDDSTPPHRGDPGDAAAWETEALIHERLFRQCRSVGDALAWRVFAYDRTVIAALASNSSPGPLVKRAGPLFDDVGGLSHELRAIEEAWTERGRFALHHDLTNCLRIGDLTEVEAPGRYLLGEVKANGRRQISAQRARMRGAVSAIETGSPLPGSGRIVRALDEPYEVDLRALMDLVDLARTHGAKAAKLSDGRALVVTCPAGLFRATGGRLADSASRFEATRRGALRRARIDQDAHHLRGLSTDLAARAPLLPPWAIYPLRPDECAGLICDSVIFEVVVSADVLVHLLEREGLTIETLLRPGHGELDPTRPVLRVHDRDRQLNVFPNALSSLLFELLRPDTWARGIAELIRTNVTGNDVMHRYADDHIAWHPAALAIA